MVSQNNDNTIVLGGFKFSKLNNRKKGILVTSVDPDDTTTSVVVSSKDDSALSGSIHGSNHGSNHGNEEPRSRIKRRSSYQSIEKTELESKALFFCRIVNKLLRDQNTSCFVGYEVIYKMVSSGLSKNRAEALALGKDLSKKLRLFYRVEFKRNTFSDDGKQYKFRPEVLLSIITKSPMRIQKAPPSPSDLEEEIKMLTKKISTKPNKKKGRRPKANESVSLIPQDRSPTSEKDWGKPNKNGNRSTMEPIHEKEEHTEDDDHSIFTEITVSDHVSSFPPVPSMPQHEDDEDSYMEYTVSERNSKHSYFEEFTIEDEDEYELMSVPTTPVVRQKLKVQPKSDAGANDLFIPNGVTGFDKSAGKGDEDLSMSTRMRRGELDIEIPFSQDGNVPKI